LREFSAGFVAAFGYDYSDVIFLPKTEKGAWKSEPTEANS
jgi:hypothetical protein